MTDTRLPPAARPTGDGVSPASALKAAWARRRLVAAAGLPLAVLTGAVVWHAYPAEYTAQALLRCRLVRPQLLDDAPPRDREGVSQAQRGMLALIRSPRVLAAAVTADGVRESDLVRTQPDPAGWLAGRLRAGFNDDTEYAWLSLAGLHPGDQAAVLNAVADAFRNEVNEDVRRQRLAHGARLDRALADTRSAILKHREELARMAGGIRGRDGGDPDHQLHVATVAALTADLVKTQAELRRAKEVAAQAKKDADAARDAPVPPRAVEAVVSRAPAVRLREQELAEVEEAIATRPEVYATPEADPLLPKLKARAAAARAAVERARKAATEEVTGDLRAAAAAAAGEALTRAERDAAVLERQAEAIRKELEARPLVPAPAPPEVELRRKEVEQLEDMFKHLKDKREKLNFELRGADDAEAVTVVNPAVPPARADVRGQVARAAGAGLAAAALVVAAVGWWEASRRRIRTRDEVDARLGLRVLGTLPRVEPAAGAPVLVDYADRIRTVLLTDERLDFGELAGDGTLVLGADARRASCRVIVVTSASPGEGKSLLALQLAASLVRSGRRALLVDADLRRPSLHAMLGAAAGPGLSEVLCGADRPGDIAQSPSDGLGFIPAGGDCGAGLRALARTDPADLIGGLLEEWDVVVIDTPPVLSAPETLLLGRAADGVLLAIRAGLSRAAEVAEASRLLEEVGCRLLGTVLNGVSPSRAAYDYRYRAGGATPPPVPAGGPDEPLT